MEMEMDELSSLKDALVDWKHIIVEADMWLRWDEDSYPYIMCAAVTVFYFLLWLIQPPILTTISLLVMVICLLDFLVPSVFKEYLNKQAWSAYKQERFEKCCKGILYTKNCTISSATWIVNLREKKPNYYFLGSSVVLLTIAFLGNAIPGLLLAFLVTIFLVLLPGLVYRGVLATCYALLLQVFVDLLKGHRKKD